MNPHLHKERASQFHIQSVQRAVAILQCFTAETRELGVTELSQQLSLNKSTVSRLLFTLQQANFVARDGHNGRYHLGLGLVSLAGAALTHSDLRRVALPFLGDLAAHCQETVTLQVLDQGASVTIEVIGSPKAVRHNAWVGMRTPLHCTASGKVFLACASPEERQLLLSQEMAAFTASTLTERKFIERTVIRARRDGHAVERGEYDSDVTAVAAAIFYSAGQVAGALSISGPSSRMKPSRLRELLGPLKETVNAISAQLNQTAALEHAVRR